MYTKMTPTIVQNIMKNDATNCSDTCPDNYEKTYVCERVSHAKVTYKHVFVRVSPIGCGTMEVNKNIAKIMTNPCKIGTRKNNAKNIDNYANMVPKRRSTSVKNI